MASITFVVPGQPAELATRSGVPAPPRTGKGVVKHSVRVVARRGEGAEVRVSASPGNDVVVLHIENGPSLVLHPEHARDLILAQKNATARHRGRSTASAADADEVQVPPLFQWRLIEQAPAARSGATRGRLDDVFLKGIDVITDAAKEFASDFLVSHALSFAASALVNRIDGQVDEGVYSLSPDTLPRLKGEAKAQMLEAGEDAPALVLVHGTFSNTNGTFAKLWTQHPDLVNRLFTHYGNRVFALDHRTLGASPISNALTLVNALPQEARLHLVTHSRGGLVGEVLAHACHADAGELRMFDGEDYRQHRDELVELIRKTRERKVRVDRFVRVACPARGTLLASRRLDAYLSIVKWALELGGIPVLPEIVDFLNGVAQYRTDPARIPGLAAQIPDSALVQWLHDVQRPITGDLRVVAGDMAGDSVTSWLKTLLADAFYWTDNDLVVQTRSMYGGTPRAEGSTFVLDRGGKVSHFAYFGNSRTAGAIVSALTETSPSDFRIIGPQSYAGESSSGSRARREGAAARGPRPELPAAIIVPGIFGSHLKDKEGRVWLNWNTPNPLQRLALDAHDVEPDGLVEDGYEDLSRFLASTHDVIELAYDWRRPVKQAAETLGKALSEALGIRSQTNQPVRIVAHSSGGLVVRALQLVDEALWTRWLEHQQARLLLLAPPNAGFWMPMQVLSGDDTLGGLLSIVGTPFRERDARQALAELPGFVELQAGLLNQQLQLSRESRWRELAYEDTRRVSDSSTWHTDPLQRAAVEWGIPLQSALDNAVELHRQLDRQRQNGILRNVGDKIAVVVGRGILTPSRYDAGADGLEYVYTDAGDGYVTHASAALDGLRMWGLDVPHAKISATPTAFGGYVELLQQGQTSHLPQLATRSETAGETSVTRKRPARTPKPIVLAGASDGPLTPATEEEPFDAEQKLRVSVVNGDLSFVREPLLLGHYRSSKLTGAEAVMDRLIGGDMAASLQKGYYPDSADSRQVFINLRVAPDDPRQLPRPEAVIVVGLGEEGKLQPALLVHTVKHGVIAWAQRVHEHPNSQTTFQLAATLVGSGGIGMTVGESAQLIVRGVLEANQALAGVADGGHADRSWPQVAHLSLVELYLDRAREAWRALKMTSDTKYALDETIAPGQGALPRPLDSSYRGADYDFIRAATYYGVEGKSISYTLDTKRARTETRAQAVQHKLLRALIREAADDRSQDMSLRRTLFRILVPVDLEPFLTGDTEAQFEVDSGTAGIPWELLDDSAPTGSAVPWAIRTKLLRKLRTADFRAQVRDAGADASVLVIGEPECDPKLYPPLRGAQREARAVAEALIAGGLSEEQVVALTSEGDGEPNGPDARTVVNALFERDWRIVHIAAHGEPPELTGHEPLKPTDPPQQIVNPRGVVLSNEVYLGPREIYSMRRIPELVFVNCCHLAARDTGQLLNQGAAECERPYRSGRPQFASGVAEALIQVGVRCVIAAGWAVEDTQAMVFARTFYQHLLKGFRFIDAVAAARLEAWRHGGNTWAAYQCYGDADWVFRREVSDAQRPMVKGTDPYAVIASARDLVLALQTIAVRCEFQQAGRDRKRDIAAQRERIKDLEQRFAGHWQKHGRVAESFALAWAKAGDERKAFDWYAKALQANDGGASVKAAEQRANLQVRIAWNQVNDAKDKPDGAGDAITHAKTQIQSAIGMLEHLVEIAPSMERASLLGSAYKRLALIAKIESNQEAETAAIESMKRCYEQAEVIGRSNNLDDFFYPALNRLSAEFALSGGPVALDRQAVDAIRANLDAAVRNKPDFWSVVGQTELRVYESLSRGDLAKEIQSIIAAYDDVYLRVQQEWMWRSVYDQANFVLSKYSNGQQERDAAKTLITHLAALSGQTRSREQETNHSTDSRATTPPRSRGRTSRPKRRVEH